VKAAISIDGFTIPIVNGKPFGEIYGSEEHPSFITREGVRVWMWRKTQKVRFFTATGRQVGPEQLNIAPALAFAYSEGWTDPKLPEWLNRGCQMECGYCADA
jgi:hypothetical protein